MDSSSNRINRLKGVRLPYSTQDPAMCECRRVKRAGDTHRPAAPPRSGLLVPVAMVWLGQHMGTAGLGRPELPGAPGLSGIRAVAAVACVDLALPEILDLPA